MLNIFKRNKIVTFEKYLEKEHPAVYNVINERVKDKGLTTAYEGLFKAVEYYVMTLKNKGEITTLESINFLEETEENTN